MSNKFVRVILTFKNPHAKDLQNIKSLMRESLTISESRLYISGPENKLHHYSTEPKESVKALIKLQNDRLKTDPNAALDLNLYD